MSDAQQICRVCYVSESVWQVDAENPSSFVYDILEESRRNNRLNGITGALAFSAIEFAQIIEGREGVIRELMAKIQRDKRHKNVRIVLEEHSPNRRFSKWSMAFAPNGFLENALAERWDGGVLGSLACLDPETLEDMLWRGAQADRRIDVPPLSDQHRP